MLNMHLLTMSGNFVTAKWMSDHNVHIANVVTIDLLIHVVDWSVCRMIAMIVCWFALYVEYINLYALIWTFIVLFIFVSISYTCVVHNCDYMLHAIFWITCLVVFMPWISCHVRCLVLYIVCISSRDLN